LPVITINNQRKYHNSDTIHSPKLQQMDVTHYYTSATVTVMLFMCNIVI